MRYVIGRMWLRAGTRREFLDKSKSYVASSQSDTGCIYFHISPMEEDPDAVVMIEAWESLEDHKAHQARDYATAFQPVAGQYIRRGDFQEMTVDKPEQVSFDLSQ